jgi:hypothetical protein
MVDELFESHRQFPLDIPCALHDCLLEQRPDRWRRRCQAQQRPQEHNEHNLLQRVSVHFGQSGAKLAANFMWKFWHLTVSTMASSTTTTERSQNEHRSPDKSAHVIVRLCVTSTKH